MCLFRLFLLAGFSLFSWSSVAATSPIWYYPFISAQYSSWKTTDFQQSGEWFDCAEDDKPLFCTDQVKIHHTPMVAVVTFDHAMDPILELNGEFSLVYFNNLQLGLRQDGFQLTKVVIDGVTLDVKLELINKSETEVDREVLQLINRYPATQSRVLFWQSADQERFVQWHSDRDSIQITYQQ
ncbi:hypothetical protein VIN01S_27650 [Vibrio inusitatus NBRC 102082]|uniref:Uncharacterized protein n=1 Tax=Vibrio inusitatus NBRC 102082 TaxID=1219070 RepID=A0A4Y3HYA3_9VIBR|nr:hypothetical protein [Vibrio inusitatus]GEA51961.1 hypothetical protein VIN01S_27650 [Vibrio inusitatus NBRC 102082]